MLPQPPGWPYLEDVAEVDELSAGVPGMACPVAPGVPLATVGAVDGDLEAPVGVGTLGDVALELLPAAVVPLEVVVVVAEDVATADLNAARVGLPVAAPAAAVVIAEVIVAEPAGTLGAEVGVTVGV
jgi:hypothetical protein